MEEQSKKSGADQKKLIVAVIFLLIVIGIVIAILALLMQGDVSIDPRYFQKASCEVENPSPIEVNACLRANCTFVSSICATSCPFDYETDPVTKCQVSCECAPSGLYQGDIKFAPQQVKAMSEKYGYADEDDFDLFYGSTESDTILWNENEVNGRYQIGYVYETTIKPSVAKIIEKAMKMIAESTCIDFVPHTNQEHYIKFDTNEGCSSFVGIFDTSKTPQTVSIGWGCDQTSTVHHELKHLLGFEHEHCRADRDAYITVKLENVEEGMEGNFIKVKKENAVIIGVPYDITSVMQYPSGSFMKIPGRYTVVEYGTEFPIKIENKAGFTEYDAFEINKLYDCLDPVTTATWTGWGDWSPCDATCENGDKYKYRRCENAVGKHVIGCPGEPLMIEPCSIRTSCPPNDVWEEWGEWSECEVSEFQSYRKRTRACASFEGCIGGIGLNVEDCPMEIESTKTWGPWSDCSSTCNGLRERGKLCNGVPCPDGIPHYSFCNTDCGVLPPAEQATWSQWTGCSETCDGIRSRQRLCGDTFCEGSSPVNELCNVGRCGHRTWMWTQWNECSATCEGTQTRHKVCDYEKCPGEETRECNSNSCSAAEGSSYSSTLYTTTATTTPGSYPSILYTTTTPGSYLSTLYSTTTTTTTPENAGDWGLWSSCSATCDGTRVRQRACRTFCYNPETETENCNVGMCSSDRGADGTDENTSLFDVKEDSVPDLCGGAGSQWYFGDFNGDRRTDAACIELDGNVAIGHTTTSGLMTELHWKGRISPCASADIYLGDVNGDRKDDFVCKDSARRKLIIRYTTEAGVFGDKEVDGGSFCTDPSDKLFALDIDGTKTMDLLCYFADNHIELRLNANFRPF
ncbi:uncharacterized protein LOC120333891 isoform X1 [Styela clava]